MSKYPPIIEQIIALNRLPELSPPHGPSQGRQLLGVYVRGLLSGVQRKNAEAMALEQNVAPRTLQRFLESITWDEHKLRDQCQRIVAIELDRSHWPSSLSFAT